MKTTLAILTLIILFVAVSPVCALGGLKPRIDLTPDKVGGYIYLANGIKVDNVVNANCHVINASPYTEFCVVWFAGNTIPVYIVSNLFGYLAFDSQTLTRVEF